MLLHMKGVEYPLIEDCIKELKKKNTKLFSKPIFVKFSAIENLGDIHAVQSPYYVFNAWFPFTNNLASQGFISVARDF